MTTTFAEKNILVKDSDGNWYAIPPYTEQEFVILNEAIITTEVGSGDWQNAVDEMASVFGNYAK